jgi:3-(methylthio)propanoyl-CoA dehydrogenase
MANFYADNDDLRWYVEHGLDWEPLVRWTEYDSKAEGAMATTAESVSFYKDILGLVGQVCAERIAPRWRELDAAHPHLEDGQVVQAPVMDEVFAELGAIGLHGLCLPRELDGMNAPLLLLQMNNEMLARADVSVCAHASFHGGMALAALMYSVLEDTTTFTTDPPRIESTRFEAAIREIAAGEAWGSMDITEPDAGSDMARLRTRARVDEAGQWRVTGQKIFITSGHGKWHFVIARTEQVDVAGTGPTAGLAGLSMFLVPAWETGADGSRRMLVSFDGVEEKLGHNASATVSISFEDTPGHLIGKRGEGFKLMLLLMNNARVGVGFESLGVAEAAWRRAAAYASTRHSMGKNIDQHEMIADMLEEMQTDIQAIRALAMEAAFNEELAQKLRLALKHFPMGNARKAELEHAQKRHEKRSRHTTPLLKWFAGEKAVEIARRGVQLHGGSGYIKETGAEKLLRDAMVFPIYEGTSQIQALMAMKDNLLAAVREPGVFVRQTARARWRSLAASDPAERRVAVLRLRAQRAIRFLVTRLAAAKIRQLPKHPTSQWKAVMQDWDPKRDFALAMLHAERLTSLLTDAAVAETLWRQVRRHPDRRDVLERWLVRAEPRSRHMLDALTTTGPRLLATLAVNEAAGAAVAKGTASEPAHG